MTLKRHVIKSAMCGIALTAGTLLANNLKLSNVAVEGRDETTALVTFDISWENSWRHGVDRDPLFLHDAAWVFFKVQAEGENEPWQHVRLATSGINPAGYNTGTGTPIELVVPEDRVGMFVRRSEDGRGTVTVEGVTVIWDIAANGFTRKSSVNLKALGLEVCYVATGSYKLGDGLKDYGQFFEGGTSADPKPYAINSAGDIECGNQAGKLWGASVEGATSMGGAGTIPAAYPNGYNAFYCMKYMVTQGQYADFLNLLTREQQAARSSAITVDRYMCNTDSRTTPYNRGSIKVSENNTPAARVYVAEAPDRACNWIAWADLNALADWSGLRPMTELEFEKACRGPLEPIAGELAWGHTHAVSQSSDFGGLDGTGEEVPSSLWANACYDDRTGGPIRVGLFARSASSRRREAGASYWGILDLSGNLCERTVSVGNATGRAFVGSHGDGTLAVNGNADVSGWILTDGTGSGLRGGRWDAGPAYMRVSDRRYGDSVQGRWHNFGGRAVRSAP